MKRKNKRQNALINTMRCPYCDSHVVLRSADGIYKKNSADTMLYICARYPACDAYVRILPSTKQPIGSLANGELRALRWEAHQNFDRLYLSGIMTRKEAYVWLASTLQIPMSQTHIGHLGKYYCRQVIEESQRLLENRLKVKRQSRKLRRVLRDGVYAAR